MPTHKYAISRQPQTRLTEVDDIANVPSPAALPKPRIKGLLRNHPGQQREIGGFRVC